MFQFDTTAFFKALEEMFGPKVGRLLGRTMTIVALLAFLLGGLAAALVGASYISSVLSPPIRFIVQVLSQQRISPGWASIVANTVSWIVAGIAYWFLGGAIGRRNVRHHTAMMDERNVYVRQVGEMVEKHLAQFSGLLDGVSSLRVRIDEIETRLRVFERATEPKHSGY